MCSSLLIGLLSLAVPVASPVQDFDIQQHKSILQKGTIDEKREALQRIAAAALAESPPSKTLGKLLGLALEDDALEVRTDAAKLLAKGQHPDVAIPALTRALDELRKELARMARPRGRDTEDRQKMREMRKWSEALCDALGSLADDRSVQALIDFGRKTAGNRDEQIGVLVAKALIKLDARPGIGEVIKRLSGVEARDIRRSGRMGANPGRTGPRLHEMLTQAARAHNLEGMPVVWTKGTDAEWRAWFARNQKAFPARLGRLEVK